MPREDSDAFAMLGYGLRWWTGEGVICFDDSSGEPLYDLLDGPTTIIPLGVDGAERDKADAVAIHPDLPTRRVFVSGSAMFVTGRKDPLHVKVGNIADTAEQLRRLDVEKYNLEAPPEVIGEKNA